MKALTLTQPWATLVAIGAKRIETRSWATKYRGPLAIHASKVFPKNAQHLCFQEPFRKILIYKHSFIKGGEIYFGKHGFPLGCVVATCELINCIKIPEQEAGFSMTDRGDGTDLLPFFLDLVWLPPQDPELSFGDYTPGRYAWILKNIQQLPEPVPAKGALGLWEWEA